MTDTNIIPYNTIEDENIKNMDLSYCPYNLLYNTNDGQNEIKFLKLTFIAPGYKVYDIENFFQYAQEVEDNNIEELLIENEIIELPIYNGKNELIKIFKQKCVICLEK